MVLIPNNFPIGKRKGITEQAEEATGRTFPSPNLSNVSLSVSNVNKH